MRKEVRKQVRLTSRRWHGQAAVGAELREINRPEAPTLPALFLTVA
jgi:hypothetical protein